MVGYFSILTLNKLNINSLNLTNTWNNEIQSISQYLIEFFLRSQFFLLKESYSSIDISFHNSYLGISPL